MGAGSQIAELERTISALRALVEEQRLVLEKYACVCTSTDIGDGSDELIVTGCFLHDPKLALNEDDMRKRLMETAPGEGDR